jgi:hypothetical protein
MHHYCISIQQATQHFISDLEKKKLINLISRAGKKIAQDEACPEKCLLDSCAILT